VIGDTNKLAEDVPTVTMMCRQASMVMQVFSDVYTISSAQKSQNKPSPYLEFSVDFLTCFHQATTHHKQGSSGPEQLRSSFPGVGHLPKT
jgi:hypothetical protein